MALRAPFIDEEGCPRLRSSIVAFICILEFPHISTAPLDESRILDDIGWISPTDEIIFASSFVEYYQRDSSASTIAHVILAEPFQRLISQFQTADGPGDTDETGDAMCDDVDGHTFAKRTGRLLITFS